MKIQGKAAIVTGGAQGIGEQICRALLERGGNVMPEFYSLLSLDDEGIKMPNKHFRNQDIKTCTEPITGSNINLKRFYNY